ncbi:hypothetical protein TSUD_193450 [Trifolium subterraneum]|uniref:Uncharacterized protein n=1 Tax=Trifolium subterraneum TaxID=3900 RepID=A0A2Z6MLB6_TRISU|nr:hypothetical protein TSUD_193450 [Trifolium subterraneum]
MQLQALVGEEWFHVVVQLGFESKNETKSKSNKRESNWEKYLKECCFCWLPEMLTERSGGRV